MLVEINLLPKKEPVKRNFHLVLISFLVAFLAVGSYYFWQSYSIKSQIAYLDQEITSVNQGIDQQQAKISANESSNSVEQLKTAIDWAKTYPLQTIPVMQHLTSLLPERGFIQSFNYSETGVVTLTVQFETATDGAYFLNHLLNSDWIEDATLASLNTVNTVEDNSEQVDQTDTEYLPRYQGQYEIHLNKDIILKIKNEQTASEGVAGT
ncbi:PilN domain-containing protein [Neobacillus muris]|uniref:PilN domain-containing protein n=1 Tax=Neobacillus muris TaxID=2941334 RepID=UPI002040E712|nr:fimbrial protein [Neobacillus muris]